LYLAFGKGEEGKGVYYTTEFEREIRGFDYSKKKAWIAMVDEPAPTRTRPVRKIDDSLQRRGSKGDLSFFVQKREG